MLKASLSVSLLQLVSRFLCVVPSIQLMGRTIVPSILI